MKSARIDPVFWRGRRVFLTGHTGFKGTWLTAWLVAMGAEVRGYALAPLTEGVPEGLRPFFEESEVADDIDHIIDDVRDAPALTSALTSFDPEIVIHMAAQPLVRLSYAKPVETYETNVMGTVHLLDACRHIKSLCSVIIVTSDKCYENREQIWGYREHDPMGGRDPYSNSKGCAELATSAWRNAFFPVDKIADHGVVVASARSGNVIGGGDWSIDRLVPDAMRAHRAGDTLVIRKPDALRPWQHVLDPLSGYLLLAQTAFSDPERVAQGWNFGPNDDMTLSVGDVISRLAPIMGDDFSWRIQTSDDDPHEARLLKLDCSAARHFLDWHPHVDAEKMLRMTADWYSQSDPAARRALINAQIAAMMSLWDT